MAELPDIDFPEGLCVFVGTPIGNLDDMPPRGLAVLARADVVYAEDTRRTRGLFTRFDIRTRLEAYHDHNKHRRTPEVVDRLRKGQRVAVVSDAGMPGIADPGYVLLQALREADLPWSVVPGPSSVLTALILSGFPTDRFVFAGYPPRKPGKLRTFLSQLLEQRGTIIILESCHRILKTLAAAAELAPDREMAIAREITKVHEETLRGTAGALIEEMTGPRLKGELVLVIRGDVETGRKSENGSQ